MFVGNDRGGGGGEEEPSGEGFVRHAYLYALGLGAALYASLAVMIVHDMHVLRDCAGECAYWASETIARQGAAALVFSCVLFLPAVTLFLLARWFAHPS